MKTITQTELFDMFYKHYYLKGLTTTPFKMIEGLGLYEEWKQYIKLKNEL